MRPPNVFAAGSLDRQSHLRPDPGWLESLLRSAESRVTLVWRTQSLVRLGDVPTAAQLALAQAPLGATAGDGDARPLVFLGARGERAYFALDVSDLDDPLSALPEVRDVEFQDLRQAAAIVEPEDGALLAYARAMMTWHQRHRFCGACGAPTESQQAGHLRRCTRPECAAEIFPRTDPAVIMLVCDGEWCMLGRQARWPPGVYSALAGFVEPGESLEDAVAREVMEEAGVAIEGCEYHSSQPWPFPSSIMLGFWATARRGEVRVDGSELEEARWLHRDQVLAQEVRLPPKLSIARRLIDDWLRSRG
ncbi:MAG TPA: NAD(+) diphosphatase [Thermoanaerobaculia bacterium]|jgi:NAD+ diphosphatase|nr:NAD(+) diphosphatase [Thermoanaerobaculia bacterium]